MKIKTNVLIIGSGIAGLYAALNINSKYEVYIVTKKNSTESNTNYAQGGIASVIDSSDSFQKHINDSLIAGAGLCRQNIVEMMVKEGPQRINDLIRLGTHFSYKNGNLDLAKEGGHSEKRIVHAADLTGNEVERALLEAVNQRNNIRLLENHIAIDLITEHNLFNLRNKINENRHCWGAYILDIKKNDVKTFISDVTILATGGLGQVYLHTTNPQIATGDGFAIAYRAGAKVGNMEFIQFHPTSFYSNEVGNIFNPSFLISEAVRGFGGKLRLKTGEEFMQNYDSRRELAPRDIVARAIDNELKRRGDDYVFLDITFKNPDDIKEHFPHIYKKCQEKGIDITREYIPVVPAAHYACGGVIVNEWSHSCISGLYACGEVSMTGVHGANRLASNSLLEALVFSYRAATKINLTLNSSDEIPPIPEWDDSGTLTNDEKVMISHSFREVKQCMWDYVGIVRSNLRLQRAENRINLLHDEVEELYKKTKVFNDIIELRNLISCSLIIIKSAKLRNESRGLHYTLDYQSLNDPKETIIQNITL